jgi:hypothetical protein
MVKSKPIEFYIWSPTYLQARVTILHIMLLKVLVDVRIVAASKYILFSFRPDVETKDMMRRIRAKLVRGLDKENL